ncbi:sulfite exporter TauE/SafE family protein [Endozoicomonas lisbonensis]|uniref:Probable membrane transporter protein n=1 Tax=Endozoicomonas lisbonensis TaxID=3120522 RepID=A0ABV2SF94_9GAMM
MTLLIGLFIGLVLGLTGAGGSVFAVPLLLLVHVPLHQAIGLSLGAVAISAAIGAINKLPSGQIQWLPAVIFLTLGMITAPLGNWLNHFIEEAYLLTGFCILVLIVASRLWHQAEKQSDHTYSVRATSDRTAKDISDSESCASSGLVNNTGNKISARCFIPLSLGAMVTGLLSGLFGIGGGFLIIPTLLYLTEISMKQAVATSLVIITAVSTSGFVSFTLSNPLPDLNMLMRLAIAGSIGMLAGSQIGQHITGPKLQKTFAVLMVIIASVTLVRHL